MFVKLNEKLIINTDEVATVEEINSHLVKTLVDKDVTMSGIVSTNTGCNITFKQGHKIEVWNVTVPELWEIFNKSKKGIV